MLRAVHFIEIDKNNNLWIETYSGLLFFDTKNKTAKRVSGKKVDDNVINLENTRSCIKDENGNLWIGTTSSGILKVNPDDQSGVYIQSQKNSNESLADNLIFTTAKDAGGNIWIANGLVGFSIYVPYFFPDDNIIDFFYDKDGVTWILSGNGLYTYDEKTDNVKFMNPEIGLTDETIESFSQDSEGNFWISVYRKTIIWNSKTGEKKYFTDEMGFNPGNMNQVIASIAHLPIAEQQENLEHTFTTWQANYEQLDDVCVFAVKV
jgi:ligand-binding sensor domain-containing protein